MDAALEAFVASDYSKAAKHYETAVREALNLGKHDARLAESLNSLAVVYREQLRFTESELIHKRALAIRQKALGPSHPDVIQSLNNLAGLYHDQGRTAEAELLLKRAQDLEEDWVAQVGHWQSYMASAAAALQERKFAEAEAKINAGLAIAKSFRPEGQYLATSLNNLGVLYLHQGRYAEAEPLHRHALAIREKVLDPDHPDVAASLYNLAGLYYHQGRYVEAELLYQRVLAIDERVRGTEHPYVAATLENYALLLREIGRTAEAEEMQVRAKAIRDKHVQASPIE